MSHLSPVEPKRHQPRAEFCEAELDFLLSREVPLGAKRTLEFYRFTLGRVIFWLEKEGIRTLRQLRPRQVLPYLYGMPKEGLGDPSIHNHARVFRTFLRFLHTEATIRESIRFHMPTVARKRLRVLSRDELSTVVHACKAKRDKSLVSLLVDSDLRGAEACALTWAVVDIKSGWARVRKGKPENQSAQHLNARLFGISVTRLQSEELSCTTPMGRKKPKSSSLLLSPSR